MPRGTGWLSLVGYFGLVFCRGRAGSIISDGEHAIRRDIRARLFDRGELQGLRKPARPMSRAKTGAAHHLARSGAV
jgi:hypothetical protein